MRRGHAASWRARPVVERAICQASGFRSIRDVSEPAASPAEPRGQQSPNANMRAADVAGTFGFVVERARCACHARHDVARWRADRIGSAPHRSSSTIVAGLTCARDHRWPLARSCRRDCRRVQPAASCNPSAERSCVAARHVGPRSAESDPSRRRRHLVGSARPRRPVARTCAHSSRRLDRAAVGRAAARFLLVQSAAVDRLQAAAPRERTRV